MKNTLITLLALVAIQGCSISFHTTSENKTSAQDLAAIQICGNGYTMTNGVAKANIFEIVQEIKFSPEQRLSILDDYYKCIDGFSGISSQLISAS